MCSNQCCWVTALHFNETASADRPYAKFALVHSNVDIYRRNRFVVLWLTAPARRSVFTGVCRQHAEKNRISASSAKPCSQDVQFSCFLVTLSVVYFLCPLPIMATRAITCNTVTCTRCSSDRRRVGLHLSGSMTVLQAHCSLYKRQIT